MATATYTVKKGDTLSEIAYKYYKTYGYSNYKDYMNQLAKINKINNVNLIYVGQTLKLSGSASTTTSSSTAKQTTVKVQQFGLLSSPDDNNFNKLFVTWTHNGYLTEHYQVLWEYYEPSSKRWWEGSDSTTERKESSYSWPTDIEVEKVRVRVKPIATKYTKNNKEYSNYTGSWTASSANVYNVKESTPLDTPNNIQTELIDYLKWGDLGKYVAYKLDVMVVDYTDKNANRICFELEQRDSTGKITNKYVYASVNNVGYPVLNKGESRATFYDLIDGCTYRVRCRGEIGNKVSSSWVDTYTVSEKLDAGDYVSTNDYNATFKQSVTVEYHTTTQKVTKASEWSHWSNEFTTASGTPKSFFVDKTKEVDKNKFDVYFKCDIVNEATGYNIEYTEFVDHFDTGGGTTVVSFTQYQDSFYLGQALDGGKTYYFRIQSVNEVGASGWSTIVPLTLGVMPAAPTTWSSVNTAVKGEPVTLYWLHNSEDASQQKHVQIGIKIDNGEEKIYYQQTEDGKDPVNYYPLDTSEDEYVDGATILWRVRTAGVAVENNEEPKYSEWSMTRTVNVFTTPQIQSYVTNKNGEALSEITSFPFYAEIATDPESNQAPITYHVSIVSLEAYETIDGSGNTKRVKAGESIYSLNVDALNTDFVVDRHNFKMEFDAGNIDLENGIDYALVCSVTMDSGLTGSSTTEFYVSWDDLYFEPTAEVVIDTDICAAHIRPYSGRIPYYAVEHDHGDYVKTETLITPCDGEAVTEDVVISQIPIALDNGTIEVSDESTFYSVNQDRFGIELAIPPGANTHITGDMEKILFIKMSGLIRFSILSLPDNFKGIYIDDVLYSKEDLTFYDELGLETGMGYNGLISDGIYLNDVGSYMFNNFISYTIRTETKYTTTGEMVYVNDDGVQFCIGDDLILDEDVLLSVYRRNFDGTFTEIASDLENAGTAYVTDPHPSLNFARYRIVAKTKSTGSISYTDISDFPIGGVGAIIQWDEDWSEYNIDDLNNESSDESWSGSMVKLPYNVDISSSYDMDVSLVNYIGRSHPVSYYGTHLGEKISCSTVIPANDTQTLNALRRLAIYTGDVYFRESSGIGYWANVKVSFNQTHLEVTIPVTIEVTRVEGGV